MKSVFKMLKESQHYISVNCQALSPALSIYSLPKPPIPSLQPVVLRHWTWMYGCVQVYGGQRSTTLSHWNWPVSSRVFPDCVSLAMRSQVHVNSPLTWMLGIESRAWHLCSKYSTDQGFFSSIFSNLVHHLTVLCRRWLRYTIMACCSSVCI